MIVMCYVMFINVVRAEFFVEIWRKIESVLERHKFSRSVVSTVEELPSMCFLQNKGDPK